MKRLIKIVSLAATIMVLVFSLTGCRNIIASLLGTPTSGGGNSGSGSSDKKTLEAPKVRNYGCVLMWDAIEGATSYEVTGSGGFHKTVTVPYCAPTLPPNSQYTVKAVNSSGTSDPSSKMSLFDPTYIYTASMDIVLEDNKEYTVSSSIKQVYVSGQGENCAIVVNDRNTDLHIRLDNVTMTSKEHVSCIAAYGEEVDQNYTVVLEVRGQNALTANDVTSVPAQPGKNTEKTGTTGYSGGNAIRLPNIVIIGDGTLKCTGGKGGTGGQGADSGGGGLFDGFLKGYGYGGTGGSGGSGIKCSKLFLSMTGDGKVESYGGAGGPGGVPGANGSIGTGWLGSITWEQAHGHAGIDGIAVRGTAYIISGMCNF